SRIVLKPSGATMVGQRAKDEASSEFLASEDNWFRPVQVRTGPDGAPWVGDMYRFAIEHPRWITPDRLARLDVRAGEGMGRIYRVFPHGKRPPLWMERLDRMPSTQVAHRLESPNGVVRDLAHRELVHRLDKNVEPTLRRVAESS